MWHSVLNISPRPRGLMCYYAQNFRYSFINVHGYPQCCWIPSILTMTKSKNVPGEGDYSNNSLLNFKLNVKGILFTYKNPLGYKINVSGALWLFL